MRAASVMIVDDDVDLAESLADMLALQGHSVQVAANGQEAVERHRQGSFDITFMDVRMPVMNGVDSFIAIRALRPHAKIVLMTGNEESIVARALAAGALGLLTKPFRIEELLEKMTGEGPTEDWLRMQRAVEVLEQIGTAEARQLMEKMAAGGKAPPTEAARAALKRWPSQAP